MTTATQTQLRRDTASNITAATPAAGEPAWDTTDKRLRIGDGSTAGGIILPNYIDIQNRSFISGTTGGSANAQTLTLSPVPSAYVAQMSIQFKAGYTNTGAMTLNVNSLGAISVKKNVGGTLTDPAAGDIYTGVIYNAVYDGTYFQVKVDVAAGLTSVKQGDISTSTGTVSATVSGSMGAGGGMSGSSVTLPGGQYGFFPQSKSATISQWGGAGFWNTTSSYVTAVNVFAGHENSGPVSGSISLQQRYITSSPPFHMGNSEADPLAHGFMFALLNSSGELAGSYIADVPPWAYNGPTDIRAQFVCPHKGTKFRKVAKKRSLEEIMDGATVEMELQEITHAHKNADWGLIPHPFGDVPEGHTVVMLDPTDDRMERIIAHLNAGGSEEVSDAIASGKIYADNQAITNLKGPPGVMIAPLRYKYTRGK